MKIGYNSDAKQFSINELTAAEIRIFMDSLAIAELKLTNPKNSESAAIVADDFSVALRNIQVEWPKQ